MGEREGQIRGPKFVVSAGGAEHNQVWCLEGCVLRFERRQCGHHAMSRVEGDGGTRLILCYRDGEEDS